MKIIKFNKTKVKNIVLALGNFDGVHVGHKKLLKEAIKYARKNKLPCFAMTFHPHPQEIICPGRGISLITTFEEKLSLMEDIGVDGVIVKDFDKRISSLTPEKFIKDFLVDHLSVKKVFVGFDFAFGKNRAGKINDLIRLGRKYGFEVSVVKPIKFHGHLVKSSTIREMLTNGDFATACKLLGHSYSLSGRVIRGFGRGTSLGFPTANLKLADNKLIPAHGVYAGRFGKYKCAINIGSRPTFHEEQFAIEVFVIGYKGNLRGKVMNVEIFKRLRPERHFSDVERLIAQIKRDIKLIKKL